MRLRGKTMIRVSIVLALVSILFSLSASILLYSLIDKYTKPFRNYTIIQECKKEEFRDKRLLKRIDKESQDLVISIPLPEIETKIEVVETDCCYEVYALTKDCVEYEYKLVRK